MVPWIDLALLIVALILLIVTGVYDILSAQAIDALRKTDKNAESAYSYAIGASVLAVLGAVLVIVLFIIFIVQGKKGSLGTSAFVLLILTLVFLFGSGVLSGIVASKLNSTSLTVANAATKNNGRTDAIVATVFSIVGFVILIGLLIAIRLYVGRQKEKQQLLKEEVEKKTKEIEAYKKKQEEPLKMKIPPMVKPQPL